MHSWKQQQQQQQQQQKKKKKKMEHEKQKPNWICKDMVHKTKKGRNWALLSTTEVLSYSKTLKVTLLGTWLMLS